VHTVLNLFLIHLIVNWCEELHVNGRPNGLSLDAGLYASERLPLEVVRPSFERVDEFVVPHHFNMVDFRLIIF